MQKRFLGPLSEDYLIEHFVLSAIQFGVPQIRERVFFIGVKKGVANSISPPVPTHAGESNGLANTQGVRKWLGLDDSYPDDFAPTLRSGMTGKNHATSVLSSTSASKRWSSMGIWPNGIQKDRKTAWNFPAKDGSYRLSTQEIALIQGFPENWVFSDTAVYRRLGAIGNSVPPPMAYAVAKSLRETITGQSC